MVLCESRKSDGDHTRLKNFVEQNRQEHLGPPQCRFMYPALRVGHMMHPFISSDAADMSYSLRLKTFVLGKVLLLPDYRANLRSSAAKT